MRSESSVMRSPCRRVGCEKLSRARGFCMNHYEQARRRNFPIAWKINPPAEERFLAKVNKGVGDACWLWTGGVSDTGYGSFGDNGRTQSAHRWSYEHFVGPVPEGLDLDHLCRIRRCVNPTHLEAVTHRVNALRGDAPGIVAWRTNVCHRGHSLEDAYLAHRSDGRITRRCRTCRIERARARAT